jgi:hypothetical protein
MSADRMEGQEQRDKRVRRVRKPEPRISENENCHAREHQEILEKPIAAIHRTDGEQKPEKGVRRYEDRKETIVYKL